MPGGGPVGATTLRPPRRNAYAAARLAHSQTDLRVNMEHTTLHLNDKLQTLAHENALEKHKHSRNQKQTQLDLQLVETLHQKIQKQAQDLAQAYQHEQIIKADSTHLSSEIVQLQRQAREDTQEAHKAMAAAQVAEATLLHVQGKRQAALAQAELAHDAKNHAQTRAAKAKETCRRCEQQVANLEAKVASQALQRAKFDALCTEMDEKIAHTRAQWDARWAQVEHEKARTRAAQEACEARQAELQQAQAQVSAICTSSKQLASRVKNIHEGQTDANLARAQQSDSSIKALRPAQGPELNAALREANATLESLFEEINTACDKLAAYKAQALKLEANLIQVVNAHKAAKGNHIEPAQTDATLQPTQPPTVKHTGKENTHSNLGAHWDHAKQPKEEKQTHGNDEGKKHLSEMEPASPFQQIMQKIL